MATLTGKTIAATYTSLLKLEGDSGSTAAGGSAAVQVKTGDDDATPLYLNTNRIGIGSAAPVNILQVNHSAADNDNGIMIVNEATTIADGALLGAIGFDGADGNVPSSVLESSCFIAAYAAEDHSTGDKGGDLAFGCSVINENQDVVSTRHMTILDSGAIGIGTVSPQGELEVCKDNGSPSLVLTTHNSSHGDGNGMGAISFAAANADETHHQVGAKIQALGTEAHDDADFGTELVFYTSDNQDSVLTARMVIDEDGKVGINESDPEHALHVISAGTSGEDGIFKVGGSEAQYGFEISYDQSSATTTKITANPTYTNTGALMHLCVDGDANANQLVLKGDGFVGIGTSAPNVDLHVRGATSATVCIEDGDASTNQGEKIIRSTGGLFQFGKQADGGGSEEFHITMNDGGNVGIGTASPDYQLEISKDSAEAKVCISSYHTTVGTSPLLIFRKAEGSEASPQPLDPAGHILGTINFDGRDNDTFVTAGRIQCVTEEVWDSNSAGAYMSFSTVLSGANSQSLYEVLRIDHNGQVGIGIQAPLAGLHVKHQGSGAAIPVVALESIDVSEPFINFVCATSDNTADHSLTTDTSGDDACSGKIKIKVNGTVRWIKFYEGHS